MNPSRFTPEQLNEVFLNLSYRYGREFAAQEPMLITPGRELNAISFSEKDMLVVCYLIVGETSETRVALFSKEPSNLEHRLNGNELHVEPKPQRMPQSIQSGNGVTINFGGATFRNCVIGNGVTINENQDGSLTAHNGEIATSEMPVTAVIWTPNPIDVTGILGSPMSVLSSEVTKYFEHL